MILAKTKIHELTTIPNPSGDHKGCCAIPLNEKVVDLKIA